MRKAGLVTVMMPVLNGELFLPFALDSLLAQDYDPFEIVILDNLSTDRTPDICEEYARRDGRIRYIRDRVNRITHDAANHLATYITGEFCMYACDDDLWAPNFLSTLVGYLQKNPDVGLAFCNAGYVDIDGNLGNRRLLPRRLLYQKTRSCFSNVWSFLRYRRVVPALFGVYRSEALLTALPFDTFDATIADVDTLFLIKLMSQTKVHGVDEILFYYRNKYRGFEPDFIGGYPSDNNAFKVWLFVVRHQWKFLRKTRQVLTRSYFSRGEKIALNLRVFYSFALFMSVLRFRSLIGKALVSLGVRDGPPTLKDIHHQRRLEALRQIGFKDLATAKESSTQAGHHRIV